MQVRLTPALQSGARDFALKKCVVVTHSDSSQFGLNEELKRAAGELTVNTLNQKGTEFLRARLEHFLGDESLRLLVLRFEKKKELKHFKYLKQFLNSYEADQKKPCAAPKMLLLLLHKPVSKKSLRKAPALDSGVTFGYPQRDWDYAVIENLAGSSYR